MPYASPEDHRNHSREYRKKFPNVRRAWAANNRAKVNAQKRIKYEQNSTTAIAYQERYRNKFPDRLQERQWRKQGIELTYAAYLTMLEKQEGKCAVCTETPQTRLQVDHCHSTGKIRGLLCGKCNRSIGGLGDTLEALERAADYLRAAQ